MTIREKVKRTGDMNPGRALEICVQSDGDVIVYITQDGMVVGDIDTGNANSNEAKVEFCVNGGKSPRTLAALLRLKEAMTQDNIHSPR